MKPGRIRIFSAILLVLFTSSCARRVGESRIEKAERLLRESNYEEAIETYREHIEQRLAVKKRPEWENPYFYLLLIGDVYLGQGDIERALECYNEASNQGIHPSLISDRYRSVAWYYEERGQLNEALELLRKYREMDTLLFDAMLDRIAKQLTEEENATLRDSGS